jgi:hypothetical protein
MNVKIEVDERTADALQARAAGLDRRWNKIAGAPAIPHR